MQSLKIKTFKSDIFREKKISLKKFLMKMFSFLYSKYLINTVIYEGVGGGGKSFF